MGEENEMTKEQITNESTINTLSKNLVKPKLSGIKKQTNWLLFGFGLGAIAIFSASAGALLAFSITKTPWKQTTLTAKENAIFNKEETISYNSLKIPQLTRPVNILVLGVKVLTSDLEEKPKDELGYHALVNSFEGLSDTMLLLRFDPQKGKLIMLSIPRDTKTKIEGIVGETKINEANHKGGPSLAAKTVGDLLGGVEIDRYVRINVQGIEKLIDALGGVDFYIPQDIKYNDDSQHLYINLKEGQQHLNGDQVLQFLRFRHDNYGDIGRIQRTQTMMRSIVEQAISPKTIIKIPEILSVVNSHLDTNLTSQELMALAAFAGQKTRSDVKMLMLPGDFNTPGKNEPSYWLPNEEKIGQMMTQNFDIVDYDNYSTYSSDNPDNTANIATNIKIAIQDTTDNQEAKQAMVKQLQKLGYNNVSIRDTEKKYSQPLTNTKIVAQNGDDSLAAEIRANLGIGEVLTESTGVLGSDVTIQLGLDWLNNAQNSNTNYQPTGNN